MRVCLVCLDKCCNILNKMISESFCGVFVTEFCNFYRDIEPFEDFARVFDRRLYHATPDDWYVVLADIRGSTKAVSEGRYKQVNIVGASCIIAVLNAIEHEDIPYVFGGDGASFLIPSYLMEKSCTALLDAKRISMEVYGLELRVGAVSIRDLQPSGSSVLVAKYAVSQFVNIAMFDGVGWRVPRI